MKCENLGYYAVLEKARGQMLEAQTDTRLRWNTLGMLSALETFVKSDLNISEDTRAGLLSMVKHDILMLIADDEFDDVSEGRGNE